jgi:hypothetical protein
MAHSIPDVKHMKKQGGKRGRPRGVSRYADEDRAPLERMSELWKRGTHVSAAAKAVAKEMELRPRPDQAIERLRKKFRQFREEKKEKASRPTRPAQSGNTPLAQMVKQARQVVKFLGPSGVKDIKGKARLVSENKRSILEAAELTHRLRKPKI